MTIHELLSALRDPAAYPHRPGEVEVRQTHISILLFAGPLVYKVKKPVRLGFLDFSSAERRLHFCREEVRLGAALAPGVYLGVAPIFREGDRLWLGEVYGPREPVNPGAFEHAVVMRRLPGERMLDVLLDRGEFDNAVIDGLVGLLAGFHEAAATGDGIDEYGHPDAVAERIGRNLTECEPFVAGSRDGPATISAPMLRRLRRWTGGFIAEHRGLLHRRVLEGRIREGHGDLHAGNICVLEDRVIIYDRIEFAPGFRCADVASDLAFLAMDLDSRGYRGFAGYLAVRYAQRTRDMELPGVLPLYKAHLAAVRGKVASIRSREVELDAGQRAAAVEEARRYFQLATSYTLGPALILTCGLPGTGKSSAARAMARPFEAVILRSDEVRKRLAGMAPTERARGPIDEGIYGEEMTARTYAELLEMTGRHLAAGRTVIVDATFRAAKQRAPFLELAARMGIAGVVARVTCPEAVVEARLAQRSREPGEVSDADISVYRHLRGSFEAPDEIASAQRIELSCEMSGVEMAGVLVERLVVGGGG